MLDNQCNDMSSPRLRAWAARPPRLLSLRVGRAGTFFLLLILVSALSGCSLLRPRIVEVPVYITSPCVCCVPQIDMPELLDPRDPAAAVCLSLDDADTLSAWLETLYAEIGPCASSDD